MDTVTIDFSKVTGTIKPLHGINNAPMSLNSTRKELRDAGIPYCRTHDTAGAWGGTHYVDIPNIFPNFDADENDPASYDFAFTDAFLKTISNSGVQPFYRLGVTIENNYKIKAYNIIPPKDFAKWARICEHVVRHFNEGWANGMHLGIEYWEIWNEPENPPMWHGTKEEYFELYRVSANHLKKQFPALKVGGYAGCGFYAVNHPDMAKDPFWLGFLTWFDDFLAFVTNEKTSAPLDFFSWHLYTTDPQEIIVHANYVDARLKHYHLNQTESIFDEWNYIDWNTCRYDLMKEAPGAAFVAAAFCLMQHGPVDKAMYYDALPTRAYCGLYYFPGEKVTKTYYSFFAFNALYKRKTEVFSQAPDDLGIHAGAAKDAQSSAALIVNNRPLEREVSLQITGATGPFECRLLDQEHLLTKTADFSLTQSGGTIKMPPLSVLLLQTEEQPESKTPVSPDNKAKTCFAGLDNSNLAEQKTQEKP